MSDRKRDDVENCLEKKGFNKSFNDHKKLIYYSFSGKKTSVWTKTSHGSGHNKLSKDILYKMAKQCRLSNKDFEKLIDCPLSRENYETILIQNGILH